MIQKIIKQDYMPEAIFIIIKKTTQIPLQKIDIIQIY